MHVCVAETDKIPPVCRDGRLRKGGILIVVRLFAICGTRSLW